MPTRATRHTSAFAAPPRLRRRAPLACLLAAGLAAPAFAQDRDIERRVEQRLRTSNELSLSTSDPKTSFSEKATLDVGGYFSFTALTLNDDRDNSRRLLQYDTTLYARASWDGANTVFSRARFRYRDFSPGDSFDERGDSWAEPFLDRYWYEFDLRDAARLTDPDALGLNVRLGRQFVDWGAGLALSETLYAIRPTISIGPRITAEALVGITPGDESIIDFDASRAEYNRDTKRAYYGGLLRGVTPDNKQFYAYYLSMIDRNGYDTPRLPVGLDVNFGYSAQYLGLGSTGSLSTSLLYEAEMVFERGTSHSDPLRTPQSREDISAFAARGQLTYLFGDTGQSRAQAETIFASGDPDRLVTSDTVGGNLSGTTDNAFNSLGFANTGLAFAPSLSNIIVARVGASTFPLARIDTFAQLQLGVDFFVFGKLETRGAIDEPTNPRTYLGSEADVYINYRVTSDLSVGLRYGAFFPGAGIDGEHDTRHFLLLGVTLSF